jgi:putative membrane protein
MEKDAEIKQTPKGNTTDHLANERTFLAWIRTCIAIMAFGFVVEKFTLFLRQIANLINAGFLVSSAKSTPVATNYSSIFGVLLVLLGGVMCIMAFFKFRTTEKQIINNNYAPSILLEVMLTLIILLVGLFLVIYLLHNVTK